MCVGRKWSVEPHRHCVGFFDVFLPVDKVAVGVAAAAATGDATAACAAADGVAAAGVAAVSTAAAAP